MHVCNKYNIYTIPYNIYFGVYLSRLGVIVVDIISIWMTACGGAINILGTQEYHCQQQLAFCNLKERVLNSEQRVRINACSIIL